jgi:anti-sigma-K factor RskA
MNDRPSSERSGPEVDDLMGAYALDAVDPDEREAVERHLANDPAARAEVDEMRETAAALASLPGSDEAPAGIWDRIADAIRSPEAPPVGADRGAERASSNVVPLERSKRFAAVPARFALPIAAAAAVVIAVLAVQVATRSPNRAGDIAAAYNQAVAHGATTVNLRLNGTGPVAARIALQPDGSGYLRGDLLGRTELPAGKTYQLWVLVGRGSAQRAISAGVLGRAPAAVAFHYSGKPDAFAITVEDAPGVVSPTKTPEAIGRLPA